MIRLTNPLLHNGRIVEAGKMIALDPDFEKAIVAAENGVYVGAQEVVDDPPEDPEDPKDPPEDPPEDPDPEMHLGRSGRGR